jgi:Flp pilus assembly pilin Flp
MGRIQLLMSRLTTLKLADLRGEDGQGVTEYGIVLAFVAVALAAVLVVFGTGITGFINKIVTDLGNLA